MDIRTLTRDYGLSLSAQNKASATVDTYLSALACLVDYLESESLPTEIGEIRRRHIEGFIAHLLQLRSEGTAHNRFRALRTFFRWCVSEEEISVSPMASMRPPVLSEPSVPVLTREQVTQLLRRPEKQRYIKRRNDAILRLFLDTGIRCGEMAGIVVENLYLDIAIVKVSGKGRRERMVPFGPETALALARYLRVRRDTPTLFGLTANGIRQMVRKRGKAIGIEGLHPHQFRHTFAHEWLSAGGTEVDLMRLCGWRSRQMVVRYAASAGEERAHAAYRRIRKNP